MENKSFLSWVFKFIFKSPKHVLYRIMLNYTVNYTKRANKDDYTPRSRYELEAIKICRNLVKNPETVLEMSTNNERFATNDELDIVCFISEKSIEIHKNDIPREIVISPKTFSRISIIFDSYLNMRRNKKKEKVYLRTKNTLSIMVEETGKVLNEKILNKI